MSNDDAHDFFGGEAIVERRTRAATSGGRCGGCGAEAAHLRRGRCASCYARWVRARPVGIGALCASCGDRRLVHLRYFELNANWLVLCHNCCARAERVEPPPRSAFVLLQKIARERRLQSDRRANGGQGSYWFESAERRRRKERRVSERSLPDATDLAVELGADGEPAPATVPELPDELGGITSVHDKI